MARPLRWGICAPGNVANDFCISLSSLPKSEHQIVAVGSRSLEKAEEFAKKFGIPKAVGSYQELAELEEVDIVYVATIPGLHKENSLRFIKAGKHVVSETPIAFTQEGVKEIYSIAREKGVFCQEGLVPLFNPAILALRKMVENGELGDIRLVQLHFSMPLHLYDLPRMEDMSLGGGMTMELGVCMVRYCNMFFGTLPEQVQSNLFKAGSGSDKGGIITLRYPGAGFGSITMVDDTDMVDNFLIIRGTKGTVKIPDGFWYPSVLIMPNGEKKEFPLPDITPPEGLNYIYPGNQQFVNEQRAVREAINNGWNELPQCTQAMNIEGAGVLETILAQNNIKYDSSM